MLYCDGQSYVGIIIQNLWLHKVQLTSMSSIWVLTAIRFLRFIWYHNCAADNESLVERFAKLLKSANRNLEVLVKVLASTSKSDRLRVQKCGIFHFKFMEWLVPAKYATLDCEFAGEIEETAKRQIFQKESGFLTIMIRNLEGTPNIIVAEDNAILQCQKI